MNLTQMLMEWAITSAALILVVTALRALLGKRVSAGLRYALWAVVLVRLLVPVQLFSLPIPAVLPETGRGEAVEIVPPSAVSAPVGTENISQPVLTAPAPNIGTAAPVTVPVPSAPKAEPLSVRQVLGWLWLSGSAVMAAAFLISNFSFFLRLRRVRAAVEGADCPLPVYTALNLPSPCLFGALRPAVYITPETAADPVMLRHVLAHEYTHFRHGDHIWNVLRSAALAIHWWNPLVWLAVVVSRRDCELACDEGALKRLGDGERIAYGRTLLALLTEKPRTAHLLTCATTMTGGQKSVWERVTRIAHAPKRWLWAAVTAVLVTALACVCAFGQAVEPEDDPDPADTSDVGAILNDLAADLSLTVEDLTGWPLVRIEGTVDDVTVSGGVWDPDGSGGFPFGLLTMEYEFEGGRVGITANWADVDRKVVDISTQLPAGLSEDPDACFWVFRVDLAQDGGTVREKSAVVNMPAQAHSDTQLHCYPGSISDGEAVKAARIAARLMTEAERAYVDAVEAFWADQAPGAWVDARELESISPDLNRDGMRETIKVMNIPGENGQVGGQRMSVWQGDELLWQDEGYYAHMGWNAVFLCTLDGEDYLLRYNPYMSQGWGGYSYQLFTLRENRTEQVVRENRVEFDAGSLMFEVGGFNAGAIAAFMDEINGLLANSVQLLNTNEELLATFEKEGRLYDSLGWLDQTGGGSLLENLQKYQKDLEERYYAQIPVVTNPGEVSASGGELRDLLLSYQGRTKWFSAVWEHFFPDDTVEGSLIDLDGDGRYEIVVILQTAHGTGFLSEEVHVFDAETLEEYDHPGLVEDIISRVSSTGDGKYFYLSAPGMETVPIPRSAAWRPSDHINFGDYVDYEVKDGRLFCVLGCDMGMLEYCGDLWVGLSMENGAFKCTSFQYVSEIDLPAGSPAAHAAELYQEVLLGNRKIILHPDQPPVMLDDVLSEFDPDDPYMKYWSFTKVNIDGGDTLDEILIHACGISGDTRGYLLLWQKGGEVYGEAFTTEGWRNRWFQNLKTDGTFECTDSLGGEWWRSVSCLRRTGGRWALYGLGVYKKADYDDSFMTLLGDGTREEYELAAATQKEKYDAVWYDFTPENIKTVLQY